MQRSACNTPQKLLCVKISRKKKINNEYFYARNMLLFTKLWVKVLIIIKEYNNNKKWGCERKICCQQQRLTATGKVAVKAGKLQQRATLISEHVNIQYAYTQLYICMVVRSIAYEYKSICINFYIHVCVGVCVHLLC